MKLLPAVLRRTVLALGAFAALAAGCAKKPLPVVQAHPSEVEYAGCYEVQLAGPTCYVGTSDRGRKLALHPVRPAGRYEIWADGKPVAEPAIERLPGPLFRVTIPPDVARLELRSIGEKEIRSWGLRIAIWPTLPAWIDRATLLGQREGGPRAAIDLLESEIARGAPPQARLIALARRAQFEPWQEGSLARFSAFQRAIAAYQREGYLKGGVHLATGLAFELVQQHDFARARALLKGISLPGGSPAEALSRLAYYKGILAKNSGDFRTAIGEYQSSASIAGRVGEEGLRSDALQEEATLKYQLGRFRDAEAMLGQLAAVSDQVQDRCKRAVLLTNRGWTRYLARESGDWQIGDPIAPFTEARGILASQKDCTNQDSLEINANINLALAFLQSGQTAPARQVIEESAGAALRAGPIHRMWWLDLQAQLALGQDEAEKALHLYRRLEREARGSYSPESQWRAAVGKARALAQMGSLAEAATSLGEAERVLDLQLGSVPLGGDRESFSDQWSAGSRLQVDILLRAGQREQALEAARRARGRVLSHLAEVARLELLTPAQRRERDAALGAYWKLRTGVDRLAAEAWQSPSSQAAQSRADLASRLEEAQRALDRILANLRRAGGTVQGGAPAAAQPLRRPRPGEILLAYFPLSSKQRWVAFCDDGERVFAKEFSMPTGSLGTPSAQAHLSSLLLDPFRENILGARRVVILPYGRLRTVDFQALPFGPAGKVLLSDRPIVYGLDIPTRSPGPAPRVPSALVVADSRGDLPEARREGDDARSSLERLRPRWSVHLLKGTSATAEAVRRAITEGIDLLHYAGHADFSGRGGWESQIPLADQSRLTLGDILALSRQPRWVVLSGCETGASDETTQVESQGLAHAFLLGGSSSVLAATRKVDDKVAHDLVLEIYRNMGASPDLAVLLQAAQKTLQRRGVSQRQWSSFRVFEP